MKNLKTKHIKQHFSRFKKSSSKKLAKVKKFVSYHLLKEPIKTFLVFLAILLVIIAIGSFVRRPSDDTGDETADPKRVETFTIGQAPRVSVNTQIEKSGVVTIVAQTGGVVQSVLKTEGQTVVKGQTLVNLSTNYQGGNASGIQRQIAARNYQHTKDTFDTQKDLINKQRDIANKTSENTEELRKITEQSLNDTQALIDVNEDGIDILNDLIEEAEEATPQDESLILSLKQQKSGLQNGLNAAKNAQRNARYSSDTENPPTELADINKELTLKQLDLQEKSLELSKDISLLQLRLAQVNEALMYPASPFAGTVERIHVKIGEVVSPGQPIATISGTETTTTAVALVSKNIAENISKLEESTVHIGSEKLQIKPVHISTQPTNGQLFSVVYHIPDESGINLTEGQFIQVSIPVGYADTTASALFIPLDAIFQTQDQTFIFVAEEETAKSREVQLGNIFGGYVEIIDGLSSNDTIILDRSVTSGDVVDTTSEL